MPNPFASMRFPNVFGRGDAPYEPNFFGPTQKRFMSNVMPQPELEIPSYQSEPMDEGGRYFDEMQRIRGQRGPALTAYQEHLNAMPTREQTKPSILRRIGAALSGGAVGLQHGFGAGAEFASDFVESPYTSALSDWSAKAQPLGESANLEREEAESQLQALTSARALGLKYNEYELKRLQNERDYGLGQKRESTRARIADLTQWRDEAVNERERKRIDAEIERAQGQLDINETIAQTGQKNAETYRRSQVSLSNWRTSRLEQLAKSSGASPNELSQAMENALQLLARDPDYAPFIDTSSYPYVVKDPRGYFGGPEQEQYQAFNRKLREYIESQINEGKLITGDEGAEGEEDFDIGNPEF